MIRGKRVRRYVPPEFAALFIPCRYDPATHRNSVKTFLDNDVGFWGRARRGVIRVFSVDIRNFAVFIWSRGKLNNSLGRASPAVFLPETSGSPTGSREDKRCDAREGRCPCLRRRSFRERLTSYTNGHEEMRYRKQAADRTHDICFSPVRFAYFAPSATLIRNFSCLEKRREGPRKINVSQVTTPSLSLSLSFQKVAIFIDNFLLTKGVWSWRMTWHWFVYNCKRLHYQHEKLY